MEVNSNGPFKRKKYKHFDDLPLLLHADDICRILGISKPYAYVLIHSGDFKTITIGSRILVGKEIFMEWLSSCENDTTGEMK